MSKNRDKEKLRRKAIELLALGMTQAETARKLKTSRQNISNWAKSEDFKAEVENIKSENSKVNSPQENLPAVVKPKPTFPLPPLSSQSSSREFYLQKELGLLDEIQEIMMPHVREGSVRAAGLMIKLSERRSKLLALDIQPIHEIEAAMRLVESNVIPLEIQKAMLDKFKNCQNGIKEIFSSSFQEAALESPTSDGNQSPVEFT